MIPRFHPLTIATLRRETADALSIRFDVPALLTDAYRFLPGQYLTLRATIAAAEIRRSYSICTTPTDGEMWIAIKRVPDGVFSAWLIDHARPGMTIDVLTPTGRFGQSARGDGQCYLALAAGSGITPILSLIRAILACEPASRVVLFYGSRDSADVLFAEALAALKDRHMDRFSVLHILSREEQDLPVLNGRLDADRLGHLLATILPPSAIDQVLLCGPEAMRAALTDTLLAAGIESTRIHAERFVSTQGGRPRTPVTASIATDEPHRAVLIADGKRREIGIRADEAILDAALRAGIDLPYACKGGMCSTCRAKLLEGSATMTTNYALEPWELASGYVLTCQARPRDAVVVVDYDAV